MRRLILLAILLTMSSCGLFKKVKKDTFKLNAETSQSIQEEIRSVEKRDVISVKVVDEESGNEVDFIVSGNVKILPTGEITGDQASGFVKSARKATGRVEVYDKTTTSTNTDRQSRESVDLTVKESERVSEPDQKAAGSLVRWIMYIIVGLIVIYLIRRKLF